MSAVLRLVDVYFTGVYSARLLFHKPALQDSIRSGTAKPHVILSICALASSFSLGSHSHNELRDDGFSKEWAEQAGKLALLEADTPSEDTVVSFTNLGLFWYSQGQWRRSLVYEGYAALNARLLRLSQPEAGTEFSLEAEIKRRRFWASFLVNQFVSEPSFPKITGNDVLDVLLPIPEDAYEKGVVSPHKVTLRSGERNSSVFAELIRILSLWHVPHATNAIPTRLSALELIDARLRQWHSKLPAEFHLTAEKTSCCQDGIRPQVLLLHATYHQCMCALHSSIIPLFSLCETDGIEFYEHGQRISAQVAYDNASEISDLIRANVKQDSGDAYRWPGFVGFALYCSCAIQLPYLWGTQAAFREKTQRNIRDNLSTMAMIGRNWRYVASLVISVKVLYQHHSSNAIPLQGPPLSLSATELAGKKQTPKGESSSIVGNNEMSWEHGQSMEHDELANIAPEQAGESSQPSSAARWTDDHLAPILCSNFDNQAAGDVSGTNQGSLQPRPMALQTELAQPSITPRLSSMFPIDEFTNYNLDWAAEYEVFLSAMTQAEGIETFAQDQALAAWFNR
ncbi:hypothetical protein GQ53DRAFT_727650 [Thozetella sp. PMI_491]|nr:hypothetical protein GQ53DRAFT_727650 [Thozetella sp. PMI_491]